MRSIGELAKLIFQFMIPICRDLDKKWGCFLHIPKQSRLWMIIRRRVKIFRPVIFDASAQKGLAKRHKKNIAV
jgi:hypothetical protein